MEIAHPTRAQRRTRDAAHRFASQGLGTRIRRRDRIFARLHLLSSKQDLARPSAPKIHFDRARRRLFIQTNRLSPSAEGYSLRPHKIPSIQIHFEQFYFHPATTELVGELPPTFVRDAYIIAKSTLYDQSISSTA